MQQVEPTTKPSIAMELAAATVVFEILVGEGGIISYVEGGSDGFLDEVVKAKLHQSIQNVATYDPGVTQALLGIADYRVRSLNLSERRRLGIALDQLVSIFNCMRSQTDVFWGVLLLAAEKTKDRYAPKSFSAAPSSSLMGT
eukprot:TRINITY_DN201_c0_g1_i1.p1 TRINITY_DN201_c0_g1~~TRINITY_DN201_c0_g1_i1.p1  ORF type:complete len:142 (-),score=4.33 TRINITY_DN201_c0_g1_i1:141-566(-)